jgi:flagellar assembly protein FliH
MTSARHPRSTQVLRGVLLHGQPHALSRPGRPGSESLSAKHQAEPDHPSPGDCGALSAVSAIESAYEAGLAEGRKQGFDAAVMTATEEARGRDAALVELRASAAAQGRTEGMAQGREEALAAAGQAQAQAAQQADQAAADRLGRLDHLLEGLVAEGARRLEEAEEDLLALSHEIVCRILGAEAAQPERIRSMVLHLLAQHGPRAQLSVHIHPDDLAALTQELDSRETPWRWVGDPAVQLGGVVLRSPEGSLDARLETQTAALRDALLRLRRERKDVAVLKAQETQTTEAVM